MTSVRMTCPYCLAQSSFFKACSGFFPSKEMRWGNTDPPIVQAAFFCGGCQGLVVVSFESVDQRIAVSDLLSGAKGDVLSITHSSGHPAVRLVGQAPEPPQPDCPQHCPDNVTRAFLEAEKTLLSGNFSLAAAGYRRAVERAVTTLLAPDSKARNLGPKLGEIEKSNLLPAPMQEWIRIVKDDGNFAMHDEDKDFETAAEVEPTREFARTLLQYLFTLPKEVEIARSLSKAG